MLVVSPFKIEARVGGIVNKLEFPFTSKIYLVFHVSLFKKAMRNYKVEEILPLKEICHIPTNSFSDKN
ncbi:hypothetical protein Lal_00036506 [Lupinus albus]|nr:hypothetical protein Lal_00036506 [Lupinus albus]